MKRQITLVEDDDQLRKNYADALRREGYQVDTCRNREEAQAAFAARLPDMAILDIMLEDELEGGFELCRQLRIRSATIPIIFLTARNSDVDKVSGLRLGAWDYMVKDTTTLDFLPVRVTALFKAIDALKAPPEAERLERGSLAIDENRKQVFWKGQQVPLTLTEFWILLALARHPGHVKDHAQLMEAANVIISDNAVTAHIKRIRHKFRELDCDFSSIRSEYGMGYRWVET